MRAHGQHIEQRAPEEGVTHVNTTAHRLATAHVPSDPVNCCGDCKHFLPCTGRRQRGRCIKWAEFRREPWRYAERDKWEDWWCGWPTIRRDTQACKYLDLVEKELELL